MTEQGEKFWPSTTSTPERWLYHFTTLSTAIEKILPTQAIKMSPLQDVNDPKESRLDGFSAKTKSGIPGEKYREFAASLGEYLRCYVKVFCATEDTMSAEDLKNDLTLGQACFKPTMWAHYGELHRGVCLVFDRPKLQEAISKRLASNNIEHRFASVEYAHNLFDTCYLISVEEIDASQQNARKVGSDRFSTNHRELFFLKHLDWQHESEWRAVALGTKRGSIYVPYMESLASVIVSMDFPAVYLDVIRDLAWKNGAGAHKVKWSVSSWASTNLMASPTQYEPSWIQRFRAKGLRLLGSRDR